MSSFVILLRLLAELTLHGRGTMLVTPVALSVIAPWIEGLFAGTPGSPRPTPKRAGTKRRDALAHNAHVSRCIHH
jgi:hypothetical protein